MTGVNESRVALLLPGRGYTVNHPVMYYAAEVARELGWRTEAVSWDGTDLSDGEVIAHGRTALASLPAGQNIVIGKSLGSLLLPDVVDRGLRAVWLTPLLHSAEIREAVLRPSDPSLMIGGTADESWDSDVARRSDHDVLELEGADHGLQLADDVVGSARFLVSVTRHIRAFLAQIN